MKKRISELCNKAYFMEINRTPKNNQMNYQIKNDFDLDDLLVYHRSITLGCLLRSVDFAQSILMNSRDFYTSLLYNMELSVLSFHVSNDPFIIIVLYKSFMICITCRSLINQYVIQPYAVGREKRSLAMILSSEIVKSYNIDPRTAFLILQVNGIDDLRLKIIREEDLIKKESMSAVKFAAYSADTVKGKE